MRRALIEEAGGRCALCGYDRCIVSLAFHHVDAATKLFPMTIASGKALATYRDEARKCVLLCSNCHGEVEAGLVPSPPPGSTFPVARVNDPKADRASASAASQKRSTLMALSGIGAERFGAVRPHPTNAAASISTNIRGSNNPPTSIIVVTGRTEPSASA
jgi:hypothetical protein